MLECALNISFSCNGDIEDDENVYPIFLSEIKNNNVDNWFL